MEPAPQPPGERRPLATRETRWARRMALCLAGRGVTPNAISVGGMMAGILAGGVFYATSRWPEFARAGWIAGAALVQLRLLANMLDGMVAMETRTASPVGELYNEIPDRISDGATLIGFGYALGSDPTHGYIAACLAFFVAYVRAMGKAAGARHEFCGPMAKPHRMFAVTMGALYCGVAPAGWQPDPGVPVWVLALIIAGCLITAPRRLLRIGATLRGRTPA